MHIFLHKRINYGHQRAMHMHAAIFVYVRGSWNSSRSCSTCSSKTTQTRLCLTVNSFAKSRLLAHINVF